MRIVGTATLWTSTAFILAIADAHAVPPWVNHVVERAPTISLRSNLDEHGTDYSDIWGYTAPDGREYALLGLYNGVAVINVTDRENPYEAGYVYRSESLWRDIKTYGHYAYCVNETANGLGVIDLADPENPVPRAPVRDFTRAHNVYVDVPSATLYVAGWDGNGVRVYSLADPEAPEFLAAWNGSYAHDVMVQDGRMFVSAINAPAKLHIVDVSDPLQMISLGTVSYPNAKTHNAWVTADGNYVMTTDERVGGTCQLWDITDPSHPVFEDVFRPNLNTIPHNAIIRGDLAFISHYELGVFVVDISVRTDLRGVGRYDTHPEGDFGGFHGAWGVFPFFPNSPRLFVVSDIERGLFVLELEFDPSASTDPAETASWPPTAVAAIGTPAPNPTRPGVPVRFEVSLARRCPVSLDVFDVRGRLFRSLAQAELPAGRHALVWDGRDAQGRLAYSGTYFLRVRTPSGVSTRPVTLLR